MNILVTGAAGFIGFHVVKRLLEDGHNVIGIDNLNTYYDVSLKYNRLKEVGIEPSMLQYATYIKSTSHLQFTFVQLNLEDKLGIQNAFDTYNPDIVIHLAAQAGVRYSIENPDVYVSSNINGFFHIIESCRRAAIKHFVYASSSSIYGLNTDSVYSTAHNADHPISLYAATKKSNELLAHTYSHLFGLPSTGLRFFTVYGPWGRPDMALFRFTKALFEKQPIEVYNNGEMYRDFTYIDDIVEGIVHVMRNPPSANKSWDSVKSDPATSSAPYKIYNIGNSKPVKLIDFILAIEEATGIELVKVMKPLQPGDVVSTYADTRELEKDFNYKPSTSIKEGIKKFVEWYRYYYKL